MYDLRESHYNVLKRFLRYLQGIIDHGLHLYPTTHLRLITYDADWDGCPNSRRSTLGYSLFLSYNLIPWQSKRQSTLSRASAEGEYLGVTSVVAEAS